MLAFGMKSATEKLHLAKPLKKIAEERSAFIEDLDGWRDRIRGANFSDKAGPECRDDMLHYYKMAMQAAELFRGSGLAISFKWRDSFDKEEVSAHSDFQFEVGRPKKGPAAPDKRTPDGAAGRVRLVQRSRCNQLHVRHPP